MRWTIKEQLTPQRNETRIIKKFAILPIQIGSEKRWLETVYIKQQYEQIGIFTFSPWDWVNIKFVASVDYNNYINT